MAAPVMLQALVTQLELATQRESVIPQELVLLRVSVMPLELAVPPASARRVQVSRERSQAVQ